MQDKTRASWENELWGFITQQDAQRKRAKREAVIYRLARTSATGKYRRTLAR